MTRVAYLGPELTFTHQASQKKFGTKVEHVPYHSITDVFMEVEGDKCDYGVVPIENSIEGAVNHTLDMLVTSPLSILSEVYLEISYYLLMSHPVRRSPRIEKIYSHPQVFGQCRTWLRRYHIDVDLIEVSSTTNAAVALIASKEENSACIASKLAADKYNLHIAGKQVEADCNKSVTRFLVIGKKPLPKQPRGDDKTSIVFSVKDKVGALHDVLVPFKKNNINLTKIESRPSRLKAWEYYFFVNLEGHYEDKNVKKALIELKKECTYFKVLGSYPKGE